VGWFTADNAVNNGVALRQLKMLLLDPLFDAKQRYIRYVYINLLQPKPPLTIYSCMEHSVDLSAKTFVQAVSPSSARAIFKKMTKALHIASNDGSGTFDLDDLDARLAGFDFDDNNGDEDENEGDDGEEEEGLEAEVDAANSIGKALLLVKQVCL
jgi:hypothetical protein